MYALNLGKDGRILSACNVLNIGSYDGMPIVNTLPDGNISDYKYINNEYVYEPLPKPEEQLSQIDILEAQVTYTAMMTDTLLGV